MEVWQTDIQNLVRALGTLPGIFGLLLAITATIAAILKPGARWTVMAVLLWSLTLTRPILLGIEFNPILFTPLQQLREYAKPLTILCMATLLLPSLTAPREWRRMTVPVPVVAFFAYQVIFSLRDLVLFSPGRAAAGIAVYALSFAVLGLGVTRFLQSTHDVRKLLISIAWSVTVFAAATAIQLVVRKDSVIQNSRLYMTTANPQFAATIIGMALPVLAYLLVEGRLDLFRRTIFGATAGLLVVFLIWTGSRTGALMSVVGLILLFRLRLGKFAIAAIVLALAFWIGSTYFTGSLDKAERIWSGQNTRAVAWQQMYRAFLNNIVFGGKGDESRGNSENSFLFTAANYGVVGLIPLLVASYFFFRQCLQIQRLTALAGPNRLMCNLATSLIATAGVGAMFEGYLLAQMNFVLVVLFIASAIGAFLEEAIRAAPGFEVVPLEADSSYAMAGSYH